MIVTDTKAVFENVEPNYTYTVEVTAAGMSVYEYTYMTANAITITEFTADTSDPQVLRLSWQSSAEVPADGWVLTYNIMGSDIVGSLACTENYAEITPVVPGAEYTFKLQQANGLAVLTAPLSCKVPNAQDFSGYGMTRSTMSFQLCKRPDKDDWTWSDLTDADYTSTFATGQKIGIVGQLHELYGMSDDDIVVLYVVNDVEGRILCYGTNTQTWNRMWNHYYGEFDIPQLPSESGEYTLTIYFNGKYVTQKNFVLEG
jgi:hypothetical protein